MWTDLDYYKPRGFRIEDVPGDDACYAFVADPIDLIEEGSAVNVFTSLAGNVFGFKAIRALRLEDVRFPIAYVNFWPMFPRTLATHSSSAVSV